MARRNSLAAWTGQLLLALLGTMLAPLAAAQEPAQEPAGEHAEVPINGEWEAVYFDRKLGTVKGQATVDETRGFVQIVYTHPKTGKKFTLSSKNFSRTGNKITIELEGAQPSSAHRDGQNYPQKHLIVPESTRKIEVRQSANSAAKALAPRKDSDLDRIKLELVIESPELLAETWSYRADPVTRRDRIGFGRTGDYELQDDGSGLVSGSGVWTRPKPVIEGAFTLQSQTGAYRDMPHYPHPFQNDKFQGKLTFRTIFIFGTDLPDGRNNRAVISSQIEGISYGNIVYPDSTFQFSRGMLKPFETGKAKLLKRLEKDLKRELEKMGSPTADSQVTAIAQDAIEAFDYLVVEATLSEGVRPGLQPFSVNGSENTWTLMFGNNRADISFVREIDPNAIPNRKTDVFGYTIQNTDQTITKGTLTIEILDDAPDGESNYVTVKPGQTISGDIFKTKAYTLLPDTLERLHRMHLPRLGPKNVEGSPIVTNSNEKPKAGRYGIIVLNKDGSFTYTANEDQFDSERYEATGDAFIPETLQVEVRTELDLDDDVVHVTIGKNGDVQKMGPGYLVAAHRVSGDRRLYRTGTISLARLRTGGNEPSATGDSSQGLRYTLPVENDDEIMATIAELGMISLLPPPTVLKVHTTPAVLKVQTTLARFPLGFSYLWKDHMKRAAACYPKLKEFDWDRSNYDYVAEVNEYVHFAWWKLLFPPALLMPVKDKTLTIDFQLGDHVALLMMRQAFNQMLIEKIDELTRAASNDKDTRVFWEATSPYRWKPDEQSEHPITQVELDIQVTGPRGQHLPFWNTYWRGELGEARKYDSLDEIPNWVVSATREAIHAYIKILEESLVSSEEIETCNVVGLVKLTGNTFENVQKWLNPRLMRLETKNSAGIQQWVPDYHARLRVDQVVNKYWQVKESIKISRQDTQHIVNSVAIIAGIKFVGLRAVIILGIVETGLEAGLKLPVYLESSSEIAFARGTVDILGYGRLMQAKTDEYSGYKYLGNIALVAGAELAAGSFMTFAADVIAAPIKFALWASRKSLKSIASVLHKSLISFRKGIHHVVARRGEALLKRYDLDVSKVPSNLKPRDYKAMMEYFYEAVLRKANLSLNDDQIKALMRLEELAANAKTRPNWSRNLDEATHQHLKDLYGREDIKELMTSAGDVVAAALKKGGRSLDEAMLILRYSAVRTGRRFNDTLKARLKRTVEPKGLEFYDMASLENRLVRKLLRKAHWFINIHPKSGSKVSDTIEIRDPAGNTDEIKRSFDPETGTLSMDKIGRYNIEAHIKAGLPHNLSEKGVPSFLFSQLRYMQKMDIGYAGQNGEVLKKVVMSNITNSRTIVQLAWFMKYLHPGKTLAELNESGVLSDFLKHTRSLEYARSVINLAGYKVKSVRLSSNTPYVGKLIHAMHGYKIGRDGESWDEFLKRHRLSNHDEGPALFDIEIEVVPHPNAFGKVASNDNVPRPDGGGGSKGGGRTSGGDTDPSGRPPNGGPPNDVGSGSAVGDEPEYMQTLKRLRQESDERVGNARDRYLKGVQDSTDLMPHTADEFENIAQNDMLLELMESAVEDAQRLGLPDDFIANRVADFDHFMTPAGRLQQVNRLKTRALRQEGTNSLIPLEETGELSLLLGRARAGTTTREDLSDLRNLIQQAADEGRNFIDDLGRTHVLMPNDTSEPLANAFTLRKLRDLAEQENLHPSKTGTTGGSGPDLSSDVSDQVVQRLANLDQGEREARRLSSEMLVRMGVPQDRAADFAVESSRSLIGSEGGSVISPLRQAIFLADGIMLHGSRRVDFDEFARVTGLPSRILEVAALAAAMERGLAALPEEILPAKFYPPH